MNVVWKQTFSLTVEGEEVDTLKSVVRAVMSAERTVGFNQYPLNEKQVKLLTVIEKEINK